MKSKMILLVNADDESARAVLEAAARKGYRVRVVAGTREAFAALKEDFQQIDGIVVDLDSGGHGFALLEAIDLRKGKPRLLALTSGEEMHMKPVAMKHGAHDCFGKPLSLHRLSAALGHTQPRTQLRLTCDSWGHLITDEFRYEHAHKVRSKN